MSLSRRRQPKRKAKRTRHNPLGLSARQYFAIQRPCATGEETLQDIFCNWVDDFWTILTINK